MKLHILTHPFWYADSNGNIRERLEEFIRHAQNERYHSIKDNLRDLEEIITEEVNVITLDQILAHLDQTKWNMSFWEEESVD